MTATLTFLVGRNKLFQEGLKSLLSGSQFEVVGEAVDVAQADTSLGGETPDVVLLDFFAEPERTVDDVTHLREILPETKIVVLTETLSSQTLAACLGAGAHAYLIKDISADGLLQSLRLVILGERVFPTQLAALLVSGSTEPVRRATSHGLTGRESQVLQCVARGDSNRMIANRLDIAEATVKVHIKGLLRKTNATNRTQAAIWALKDGLGAQRHTG